MLPSLALAAASLIASTSALPFVAPSAEYVQLFRRSKPSKRSTDDVASHALAQAEGLRLRYGSKKQGRRRATSTTLTNLNADSQYYGTISVGTPSQSYFVIFDTGSADTWLSDTECTPDNGCPASVATYSMPSSTSVVPSDQSFEVVYGSGSASGMLVQDTIALAGFSVAQQTFAAVNETTGGLLSAPVSGLMGLGFQPIAASKAVPFWQSAGITEFGFALTRYQDNVSAQMIEPGGTMVVNGVNSSLFTGELNYVPLVDETFWLLSLDSVAVNGTTSTSAASRAAVDTGTTLVGGPTEVVDALYRSIPGAEALSGDFAGYYGFPCNTVPTVTFTLGGSPYSMAPTDFNLGNLGADQCLGAVFAIDTSSGSPDWILGASFIKSYYVSFRSSPAPAAIGFAPLSAVAVESLDQEGAIASRAADPTVSARIAFTSSSSSTRLTLSSTFFVLALLLALLAC